MALRAPMLEETQLMACLVTGLIPYDARLLFDFSKTFSIDANLLVDEIVRYSLPPSPGIH
jgi:hypothetical protein